MANLPNKYNSHCCAKFFTSSIFVLWVVLAPFNPEFSDLNFTDYFFAVIIGFFYLSLFQIIYWPESNIFYWLDTDKNDVGQESLAFVKRLELGSIFLILGTVFLVIYAKINNL